MRFSLPGHSLCTEKKSLISLGKSWETCSQIFLQMERILMEEYKKAQIMKMNSKKQNRRKTVRRKKSFNGFRTMTLL
jgi:predicted  nucleic acid-binding Zn ribbon protein